MEIKILKFEEFSVKEIYEVLKLRCEVFVVEQDCVYQDLDGKDNKALHVLGYEDGLLIAYARCFDAGIYFEAAAIGRILVRDNYRKLGYGHQITKAAIKVVHTKLKADKIKLSAQTYLVTFYETHGFKTIGERYLEDGIPHIGMIKA